MNFLNNIILVLGTHQPLKKIKVNYSGKITTVPTFGINKTDTQKQWDRTSLKFNPSTFMGLRKRKQTGKYVKTTTGSWKMAAYIQQMLYSIYISMESLSKCKEKFFCILTKKKNNEKKLTC